MGRTPTRRSLLLLLFPVIWAVPTAYIKAQTQGSALAFAHVTVIDGTGAPAKSDQTVVISGTRITVVGPSPNVRIPPGARTINGAGKFLIPGLWDMHAHLEADEFDRNAYLRLFVANGVTGIRIMQGMTEHHRWRKEIEGGKTLGPRMIIASPIIDGPKSFVSDAVVVNVQLDRIPIQPNGPNPALSS